MELFTQKNAFVTIVIGGFNARSSKWWTDDKTTQFSLSQVINKPTHISQNFNPCRGGTRTAATPKMELFVIIVKDFQPLTTITKCSILDVAAVLDPLLMICCL